MDMNKHKQKVSTFKMSREVWKTVWEHAGMQTVRHAQICHDYTADLICCVHAYNPQSLLQKEHVFTRILQGSLEMNFSHMAGEVLKRVGRSRVAKCQHHLLISETVGVTLQDCKLLHRHSHTCFLVHKINQTAHRIKPLLHSRRYRKYRFNVKKDPLLLSPNTDRLPFIYQK